MSSTQPHTDNPCRNRSVLTALLAAGILSGLVVSARTASSEKPAGEQPKAASNRFDLIVRNDFFTGFAGDKEALARGMKTCEATLAQDPKHAEALVWHGAGLMFQAGQAFQDSAPENQKLGREKWQRGLQELDEAVKLEPENIGVRIPHGAVCLTVSRYLPDPKLKRELLDQGTADYEKTYALQKAYFSRLGTHPRGELLFGLAEGWRRLGDAARARTYLEQIVQTCKDSPYETEAKEWLAKKLDAANPSYHNCIGCHVEEPRVDR
jgi:hypothetical protein